MAYNAVIIGGGPAGMMAAARASERGGRVLILEKNESLGKKLFLTGHTRCNLSNVNADDKGTMIKYGKNYKFLYSSFSRFGVKKTLDFFNSGGLATKLEDNGRVFPKSDRALDVLSVLKNRLMKNKVEIKFGARVKKIVAGKSHIINIILSDEKEIFADNFIIAAGGKSYPSTGSSGDAYEWLAELGHTINAPRPALTAVMVKEKFVKELEGLSLKEVKISIYQNQKKLIEQTGDILFTADGLSGPLIIDLSRRIGEIASREAFIKVDLFPGSGLKEFEKKIQADFHNSNNKMLKNFLSGLVPPKLLKTVLSFTKIDAEKNINSISKPERQALAKFLKEMTFSVSGLKGFERAMITAGGVDTKEVDPKTMRSRLYKNLFFAGEILDLDGPSGGYNLQICWSTGYISGDSVDF